METELLIAQQPPLINPQGQKLQSSVVFQGFRNAMKSKVGVCLEGGSRSTKTWSVIQGLLVYCQDNRSQAKEITILRDRLSWLKATIFKDFEEILKRLGWWRENNYHQADMTYELFGNLFSFIGADEEAKFMGRKQHRFHINELIGRPGSAYNVSKEVFDQLEMRTSEGWSADYNPKVTSHWIYGLIDNREDVEMIHSTQLQNPWLPEIIRKKILGFEPTPENFKRGTADTIKWQIYGLGIRAQHEGLVFKNIGYCKIYPSEAKLLAYGLDFGYSNDVTALVKVGMMNGDIYRDEIIYETGLLNTDIMRSMERNGIQKNDLIVADSAEPKSIAEFQRAGWNVQPAQKGKDSISIGIDILSRYKIITTETSLHLKQEDENYVYKEDKQTGKLLNVPIDDWNHGWDGTRYVALNCLNKQSIRAPRFNFS